jgi:hypothetical protein
VCEFRAGKVAKSFADVFTNTIVADTQLLADGKVGGASDHLDERLQRRPDNFRSRGTDGLIVLVRALQTSCAARGNPGAAIYTERILWYLTHGGKNRHRRAFAVPVSFCSPGCRLRMAIRAEETQIF